MHKGLRAAYLPGCALPDLLQTFNQDCVMNPSAANKSEASPVWRYRKMRDLLVTQIADQARILIIERNMLSSGPGPSRSPRTRTNKLAPCS